MKVSIIQLFLIAGSMTLINVNVFSQNEKDIYQSLSSQNYETLVSHLNTHVDVCFDDNPQLHKKQKAIDIIKAYFNNNPITKIEGIHYGSSKKSNTSYKLAKVSTKNGNFRLLLYFENVGGKQLISEFRVERF